MRGPAPATGDAAKVRITMTAADSLSESSPNPAPKARWGAPLRGSDGLEVRLRAPVPSALALARPSALFVHGAATAPEGAPHDLMLTVGERRFRVRAQRMPSPTLARELGPRAARAIFWGFVPVGPSGAVIGLSARVGSGEVAAELGAIKPAPAPEPATPAAAVDPRRTVAICMATHEPSPQLLAAQIDSIRAQDHGEWICLISDDASSAAGIAALEAAIGSDPRFVVSRSPRRLGAYENFHRALRMVPAEVGYVALSDQDDRWHPDKLATLIEALGDARLAYSDMRVVGPGGEPISDTYWTRRRPGHESFASLLLANSVTGAAALFRRELLDEALPLPPRVGDLYHDHWLALVAAALGEIAYVRRPLYDYVQHSGAVLGHARANLGVAGGGVLRRLRAQCGRTPGSLRRSWRGLYFGEYCRLVHAATALDARLGDRIGGRRRRALALALRPDGSPLLGGWLAVRQLRRLWRDETLGAEAAMLRGLAWRTRLRLGRGGDPYDDADLPAGIVDPVEALAGNGAPERPDGHPHAGPSLEGN